MAGRRGPESESYDELKGRQVLLWWRSGESGVLPDTGVLRWVDRYTVGILFPDDQHVTLVFKQALVGMRKL